MKNQTKQPKMYRLLTQTGYASLEKGEEYPETHQTDGGDFVRDCVRNFPQDWQLIEPEQKPFTPTHEVTDGQYKNETVAILEEMPHQSEHYVKNADGEKFYVHSEWLRPLPLSTKTHLSESQHQSLIKRIENLSIEREFYIDPAYIEIAVREWAQQNNIELP